MATLRARSGLIAAIVIALAFVLYTTYSLRNSGDTQQTIKIPSQVEQDYTDSPIGEWKPVLPETSKPKEPEEEKEKQPEKEGDKETEHELLRYPIYKPNHTSALPPVVDNFPLAAAAHSAADLPPIPKWNQPPSPHVPEMTPLFIGFTRNWRLLQQTVVSHITAGWPAEDIYVFENTGTMKSNEQGLLSLQNPFFLNHTRLHMFGVNIIITPTLFNFAQLQNFFLWTAIEKNYTTYFWGHMDVVAMSAEPVSLGTNSSEYEGHSSIYTGAVKALRSAISSEPDPNASDPEKPWAARFFAYDRLALVNRAAYESIGGFDTAIPYYYSDCDMHDRLKMYGFEYNGPDVKVGNVTDVAGSLDDLLVLYRTKDGPEAGFVVDRPKTEERREEQDLRSFTREEGKHWVTDSPNSKAHLQLLDVVGAMAEAKGGGDARNSWQARQSGGKGEPYYRDPEGFEIAIAMTTQTGKDIYAEKWGHKACSLLEWGRKAGDEWRIEHDWE
ncbi:hypothetical protein LSUE1_G001288 [Lachnellula suecica]|uniref:Uncharacterized protein n=1 Tax=Lachnellula suecica TaxID=602035 RepID=A0A8T9CIL0_9HELO|nr:hypothetical protein LSUE1_G001288 [Lachnellula suecica]